jgi:hypothetical protein
MEAGSSMARKHHQPRLRVNVPVSTLRQPARFLHAGQFYTLATEAESKKHPAAELSAQRPGGLVLAYCEGKERVPVSFAPDAPVEEVS